MSSEASSSSSSSSSPSPVSPRLVSLILFGVGQVGRCFLSQLVFHRQFHRARFNLIFQVAAVADSTAAVCSSDPALFLSDSELSSVLAHKSAGFSLSAFPGSVSLSSSASLISRFINSDGRFSVPTIAVDCSASDSTIPALDLALRCGAGVATANKRPLAASQAVWDSLASPINISRLRGESTVGAASPMFASCSRLVSAGDSIHLIEGTFSGSIGFLMSQIESGEPFSAAVQAALRLGYTEPDPRDDLGGLDVARKALILSRLIGLRLEMSDIAVEPLFPPEFAHLDIPQFLSRLPELDGVMSGRSSAAASRGEVLRYIARIDPAAGRVEVALRSVPASSPLGRLKGTDNMVAFHTRIFDGKPVIVQGSGAGGDNTASGVIADCVELAATIR